jgi:hypothetical protein
VNTIEILAVIGGITVILTAANKIPAALAEFLRACILVADAARDLRAAIISLDYLAVSDLTVTPGYVAHKPVAVRMRAGTVFGTPAAGAAGAPEVPPVTALIVVTPQRGPVPVLRGRRLPGTCSPSTGPCAASAGQ